MNPPEHGDGDGDTPEYSSKMTPFDYKTVIPKTSTPPLLNNDHLER
ncbi:hypothetical protein [uncultured Kocuria sp.]|nr:hypothetical protein [uncultured Kocuria sp.]MCT1368018.1 hypothetical protein [Rothia sp. p3-SID1597]